MKQTSQIGSLIAASPRRLVVVLTVMAALLVPAAVAWACNPSPGMKTDKLSYEKGETMIVSGHYFSTKDKNAVTLRTDPAGAAGGPVAVRKTGTFRTQMAAPNRPGSYTLLATSSNGSPSARTTFEVASPSSTEPPSGGTNNPQRFREPSIQSSPAGTTTRSPAGSDERSSQPINVFVIPQPARARTTGGGTTGTTRGGGSSAGGSSGGFQGGEAARTRTTGGGSSAGGSGGGSDGGSGSGGSGGGNSGDGGAASGSERGVILDAAGRPVFVDSLAPADRRAGGAGRTTTAADGSAGQGPSERAATGDLWSGFRSGKAPSLLDAGDGSPDDGGSGASIGLALLGLGLVGLLSALAVAEVRRRRALAG
ncbi:MAG: hypothetical protein H0U12_07735 [Thermoleophilaceae bacterium]|nr:hypothetical protein [Thermoleophilaceae bacterium]